MIDKERLLEWLVNQQYIKEGDFHSGGFSPYPEVINASGTISTALALRALIKYNESGIYDDAIKRGIDFLLRSQIDATENIPATHPPYHQDDGGFPPMGDLELIIEVSSPEATAEAIKALRRYSIEVFSESSRIESIKARIRRAENHLLFDEYWYHGIKENVHEFLSCLEVLRHSRLVNIDYIDLKSFLDTQVNKIINLFEEQGYLPFKFSKKDEISITNSVIGLELLERYPKLIDIRKYRENLKDVVEEEIMKKEHQLFTEYDPIELYPRYKDALSWASPDSVYPECYSLLPSLVYLFGEESELVAKVADKVVDNSVNVWRGRKEPSVKETARLLLIL
ncbi:MAG: hypothetical protein J7K73_01480 [Nanoarchaeota archaeon]|nr:hypothetical protein [Nanoarchaeota archaeon]